MNKLISSIILTSMFCLSVISETQVGGCCASTRIENADDEHVDDALTEEQLKVARQYAADFGIQNIDTISYIKKFSHYSTGGEVCVIGDKVLTNNMGRYKQLDIDYYVLQADPPEPLRKKYYSDCTLTIQSFVEFDLRGDKVKVLVDGADPELILNALHKIFSNDYAVDQNVDKAEISQRLTTGRPIEQVVYSPWWDGRAYAGDCYMLLFDTDEPIYFTVNDEYNVLLRKPEHKLPAI